MIGRGGFGQVWRVESKKKEDEAEPGFAVKKMLKARVMNKKSNIASVMDELKLLKLLDSKFLVNVHYAFQDVQHLYLVMDLLLGGDLRHHFIERYPDAHKKGEAATFNEEETQFFCACMIHALETVHSHNVIHRDIKPENLVFDSKGYLKLTDFGLSRQWHPGMDNHKQTSGTLGYMAPEVMFHENHGIAADYFAVGVVAWECMFGEWPYKGKNKERMRAAMKRKQAAIPLNKVPCGWSFEAAEFINEVSN